MPRDLSPEFRAATEASRSEEVFLVFATITHEKLSQPIRVVNDVVDYEYGNEIFKGCPFDITLPSDTEERPTATISIQNVDRQIGEAIEALIDSPRIKFEVLLLSQFDDEVDPVQGIRFETGYATPDYVADQLRLAKMSVDAMTITGSITSFDYSAEPWPFLRATKNRLPGLYR